MNRPGVPPRSGPRGKKTVFRKLVTVIFSVIFFKCLSTATLNYPCNGNNEDADTTGAKTVRAHAVGFLPTHPVVQRRQRRNNHTEPHGTGETRRRKEGTHRLFTQWRKQAAEISLKNPRRRASLKTRQPEARVTNRTKERRWDSIKNPKRWVDSRYERTQSCVWRPLPRNLETRRRGTRKEKGGLSAPQREGELPTGMTDEVLRDAEEKRRYLTAWASIEAKENHEENRPKRNHHRGSGEKSKSQRAGTRRRIRRRKVGNQALYSLGTCQSHNQE